MPHRLAQLLTSDVPDPVPGDAPLLVPTGMAAWVASRLPDGHAMRAALQPHRLSLLARQMVQRRNVVSLLAGLETAGVECVLLKGFMLAELAYPVPGARPYGDVDVLLHERDLPRLLEVAARLGWRDDGFSGNPGRWNHEIAHLYSPDGQVRLLSIPRDTWVNVPGWGYGKINSANRRGGPDTLVQAVQQLTGLHVDAHALLSLNALRDLTDAAGGVNLTVPEDMRYDDTAGRLHINLKAGPQHLNGQQAEGFLRFRHDALGDIGRVSRQQMFLGALAARLRSPLNAWRLPAVVGARVASQIIRQDDWVVIDGDAGVVIVNPSPIVLAEYSFKQRQIAVDRERLARLKHTPAVTLDGERIDLLANIEQPADADAALAVGAVGVGLFRTEFLFMGRNGKLPDEEEQYQAYRGAVEGMHGLPVTIRTVDIGADKPLDRNARDDHLNPALGLRAIRWSLADPAMFLTQLRAILRAAAHGKVNLLIPMVAHLHEIQQTKALLAKARDQLDLRGEVYGTVRLGAMIEVPAAALSVSMFLKHFDYLSIGTNDLIQYTLAIDRVDEGVAHLYDPLHPAVLKLLAGTIAESNAQGKPVSVCGEMAGDVAMTRLLLGLGLRVFSMHPSQILAVKQQILRADTRKLRTWAQDVISSDDPATAMAD